MHIDNLTLNKQLDWVLPTDVEAKLTFGSMLIGSFVNII